MNAHFNFSKCWLSLVTGFKKGQLLSNKRGRHANKPGSQSGLGRLEMLEDRSVPASLYGDIGAAYTITNDVGTAGFSNGDSVTWNGSTKVSGLTVGVDAFGSAQGAIGAAKSGDTVNLAPQSYGEGTVIVGQSNLTVNVPTGASGFSLQLANAKVTDINLTGDGAGAVKGNQWNNNLSGNSGDNLLDAEYDIADVLKSDPSTPVSIPTTATGTSVSAISPGGRLVSNKGENFMVFRLRNGTANPITVNANVHGGAKVLTNFVLPANTDTFVAAPVNASWSAITLVGSGIGGFPKANGSTGYFSFTAGGDDTLTGGAGNDTLKGGLGIDGSVFSGNRSDYSITVSDSTYTIVDNRPGSPDGKDTLTSVEKARFSDSGMVRLVPSNYTVKAGSVSDIVFGNNTVQGNATVTLSLDGNSADGVLVVKTDGTLTAVSGDGTNTVTLTGSASALNKFLSTTGNIGYKAASGAPRNLTFTASDGIKEPGFSTMKSLDEAPVFTSNEKASFTYGDKVAFQFEAKSSSMVSFKAPELPAGLTLSEKGELVGSTRAGEHTFKVIAINASGQESVQTFTLVINKAILEIKASGFNKNFDGNTNATVQVSDNRIVGDRFDILFDARFADFNVGINKTISLSNLRLSGDAAENYTVAPTASTTANIIGTGIVNGVLNVVGSGLDDHIIIARQNATQLVVIWTIGNNPTTYTRYNLADLNRVMVFGVDGNDRLTMNAEVPFDVTLAGGNGDDILRGGNGNDLLQGDAGNDTLYGSLGNDSLEGGLGSDTLFGQAGNDILVAGFDDNAPNTLDGGDGADNLYGSGGNDSLTGGANNANDGVDGIYGFGGNDTLFGGAGNDLLDGGDGNDAINGASGDDLIFGGNGNDSLIGETGNDIVLGGAGDDNIQGNDGNDVLVGGDGNDTLAGSSGQDILIGGLGVDILRGEAGDDIIIGGYTECDNYPDCLKAMQTEWSRTDITIAQKKVNLGQGVGPASDVKLNNSTITDDLVVDQVFSSTGDDWLWT